MSQMSSTKLITCDGILDASVGKEIEANFGVEPTDCWCDCLSSNWI
jgi:hypothetical protein